MFSGRSRVQRLKRALVPHVPHTVTMMNERTPLNEGTSLTYPSLHSWAQIKFDDEAIDVRTQIQTLIRHALSPWETVELISRSDEIKVMDVLQQVCLL